MTPVADFPTRSCDQGGPIVIIHTESKPQGWRAVAVFDDGRPDALLYLGRSSTQVRATLEVWIQCG